MIDPKILKSPPVSFRGLPFWSLNDRLEPGDMIRQVESFHRAGLGGFFLHARIGLITEYLGKEWMTALRAAIEKAAELGLEAWLYDEDKWPSGFAGGLVPMENPEYRGQYLGRVRRHADLPEGANLILQKNDWFYFTATVPMGVSEFNGTCYTDLMNPDAVKAYIRSTHEKYKSEFGSYFGTVIPGIFTDEPIMRMREGWGIGDKQILPYSPQLVKHYEEKYGTSPFLFLEELYEKTGDHRKSRYRYWRCASEQFTSAFTRQLGVWCAANRLKLTGHFMYEDSVESQTRWIGKTMSHYEHMQVPGMDHLGLNIDHLLTAKQVSSAANQQGKKETLSEMFGCAGQNMSFEDRRWIGGWHGVLGVNVVCHHLSLYSARGLRKRDYPPTFSWHQPWWTENVAVEDWQARLSYLLRQGQMMADVLVIHPAESGWCLQEGSGAEEKVREIDGDLKTLLEEMTARQISFELGDEDFMAREAKVEKGQLVVGEMKYRAVIIPSMETIRASTLDILKNFKKIGGNIFLFGSPPKLVDGEKSVVEVELAGLATKHFIRGADLEALSALIPRAALTGKNLRSLMMQERTIGDERLCILFNASRHVDVILDFSDWFSKAREISLESGEILSLRREKLILAPAETRSLIWNRKIPAENPPGRKKSPVKEIRISGPWSLHLGNPNAFPLDFVAWSLDQKTWQPKEPCLALKNRLDLRCYRGPLSLRFEFNIKKQSLPREAIFFASEFFEGMVLRVNGAPVISGKDSDWDPSLRKTDVGKHLVRGKNVIETNLEFFPGDLRSYEDPEKRYGTELETAYLLGDFGVYGKEISAAPIPDRLFHDAYPDNLPPRRVIRLDHDLWLDDLEAFSSGELTTSGLPFYAGEVTFSKNFHVDSGGPAKIRLDHLDATTMKARLNGGEWSGILSGRPFEIFLPGALRKGNNTLEISIRNSLRNRLGPHHHTLGELAGVGPYSFVSRDFSPGTFQPHEEWSLPENRKRQISWSDDYFLVRFGLGEGCVLMVEEEGSRPEVNSP